MVYNERNRRYPGRQRSESDIEKAPRYFGGSQYTLTCGCVKSATGMGVKIPALDAEMYCVKHKTVATVEKVEPEWSIQCAICRHTRYYGQARMTAFTYASKHAISRRHAVRIYYGSELKETSGRQYQQLTLVEDDAPPF